MSSSSARRRIVGAAIGNVAELYDFFLYGLSAPVLAVHFFPKSNPTAALLGTFAVYAVAFLVRPLGGLLFGHLTDRRGRIRVLVLTVLLMGAGTMITGLLPAYTTIGIAAPILLVLCRLAQGLSLGGEASGSYSFTIESAPDGKRARSVNLVACFAFLPAALAGLFILVLQLLMGKAAYIDWGWRIPFIVGGLIAVAGVWLRRRLDDPEEYTEAAREAKVGNPLAQAVRTHLKSIVIVTLLIAIQAVSAYVILGYMYTFLVNTAKLSNTSALLTNAAAIVTLAVLLPIFSIAVDRIGRKPMLFAGAVWLVLAAYPAFKLAASGSFAGAYFGQLLIAIGSALTASACFVTVLELFPTAVRGAGHAISYNLGNALFGGTAPLIAEALISGFGSPIAPAFYVLLIAALGIVVIAFTPETKNVRLRDSVGGKDESATPAPEPLTN
ncbi:MHS family MFS transporter [Amycolatopsis acidicola]|uniref:MHS family MFS transporter n=1 Tax=Amycolatopsis acidicola TaxID=2596893 RepID=A0A5N0VDP3_9PSEU|nr:MFS transporter [Amycolatopsis acidicola]KAA9163290.1 MHS family MFS transporter [Amycolatopsis acidicola]